MTGPLNPCPFCGGTKIDGGYNEYGGFVSICANCDTYGPPAAEMSKDAIIAAWNTRAPEPKVQALVEVAYRRAKDLVQENIECLHAVADVLSRERGLHLQVFDALRGRGHGPQRRLAPR